MSPTIQACAEYRIKNGWLLVPSYCGRYRLDCVAVYTGDKFNMKLTMTSGASHSFALTGYGTNEQCLADLDAYFALTPDAAADGTKGT